MTTVSRPLETRHEETYEEPQYSTRDTLLTMLGVLMVMLLASLDQTIVSTAMPRIIADLQGFDRYTWVSTSYLLASTVMVPIYGKLSDIFGRKSIFLVGVVIFLTGSALSGAAQTMDQLVLFRAFQGIGAGALMPIAIAIVADLFAPRERAKWQGVTGAVWGLSSIVGPTAGGWITEHTTWRWVFYVNLPIGLLAMLVLIFLMPTLKQTSKKPKIDYLGAALLVATAVPLLLGFSWAGSEYAWGSPIILGLFALAINVGCVFVLYESIVQREGGQPIIEPSLFRNSIFTISTIATVIFSMALFGSTFFIPLFVQGVVGITATNSGLVLTPLMLTSVVGSVISGQLVARTGRYKWAAISGMLIGIAGSWLLMRLDINASDSDVLLAMIMLGLGMGTSMSLYTLIVQNALPQKIGQATCSLVFFRSIGGTIALAAMGSVMNASYLPAFHGALPEASKKALPVGTLHFFDNPQILLSQEMQSHVHSGLSALGPQGQDLYTQLMQAVKLGLTQGIHHVFLLCTLLLCLGLVVVLFLKEIPLRGKGSQEKPEPVRIPIEA
ncbi:MDR family MFS transporter [Ktedonobacter robiniae]|nr:MDR family MFS transporter [Ktedonobacter robiniae]